VGYAERVFEECVNLEYVSVFVLCQTCGADSEYICG